jgi:hypothetical protein
MANEGSAATQARATRLLVEVAPRRRPTAITTAIHEAAIAVFMISSVMSPAYAGI